MIETFELNTPIEYIAERLASVYRPVTLAQVPMFRWLHIINDTTILAEEVRRNRPKPAAIRAGKILMRLLDFLGYYLHVHKMKAPENGALPFPDLVATVLRAPS